MRTKSFEINLPQRCMGSSFYVDGWMDGWMRGRIHSDATLSSCPKGSPLRLEEGCTLDMSGSWHSFSSMWVSFGWYSMFIIFYCIDLHNKRCVALANLQ